MGDDGRDPRPVAVAVVHPDDDLEALLEDQGDLPAGDRAAVLGETAVYDHDGIHMTSLFVIGVRPNAR